MIKAIIQAVSAPVTSFVKGRAELKQTIQDGKNGKAVSTANWENIGKRLEGETWKDEYVTIIMTKPIIGKFFGGWFGWEGLTKASDAMITTIPNYEVLLTAVVLAAIARKTIK